MFLDEIRQLKTGPSELRKFGFLVGAVLAVLGTLVWIRHKPHYLWMLVPGILLILFGAAAPRALKQVYIAWMSLAIVLGFLVSSLLLSIFFFLVITPVGLVARAFGQDFLRLKLEPRASSYWIPFPKKGPRSGSEYEQQF